MLNKRKILICAGGTGGHMLPAMRLGNILIKENHDVIFSGMNLSSNTFFEKEKYVFVDIPSSPITLFHPFKMLSAWIKGMVKSFYLIKRFKPEIVVGFGSFHTFPLLLCVNMLNIPYVIFEANVSFGRVNRLFLKKAKSIASIFPNNMASHIVDMDLLTCNMKKKEKETSRKKLHLKKDLFTLLIFGGSQGAEFINEIVFQIIKKYKKNWQIIHVTGSEKQKEKIKKLYDKKQIPSVVCVFEKNMPLLYSAADLAVTRAGAATMAELIFFSLPSVMIPYPFASENHQVNNALFFQNVVRGGKCLCQNEITVDLLLQTIENLSQYDHMEKLKRNIIQYKEKRENSNDLPLHMLVYKSLKEKKYYG